MRPAALAAGRPLRAGRRAIAGLRTGTGLLSVGTLASGVLAYAFNIVAARALGVEAYGPVAVLWAAMFVISVVLFRPVEQTLSRGIAERLAHGDEAHAILRSVGRLAVAVTALVTVVMVFAWQPVTDRLFGGDDVLTASLIAAVAGYGLSYFVRGLAGGLQWFGGYGGLLLADGAVRFVLVLPVVFIASAAIPAIAIAVAAMAGALAPLAERAWRARGRPGATPLVAELDGRAAVTEPLGRSLAFAAPVAVIAASEQILVSGGALLVALTSPHAAAAAGTVFAATMLIRAPVFLFQGVAAFLLPTLTSLDAQGETHRFRTRILSMSAVMLAGSAMLTVAALAWGPNAMHLLFGPTFDVGRSDLAILSAGIGFYLVGAILAQAALARRQAGAAAAAWATSAALFVVLELTLAGGPMHRVSTAFTVATAVACALMAACVLGRSSRPLASTPHPAA